MNARPAEDAFDMASALARCEPALRALLRREAGTTLLRFDSLEDLLQGVHAEAVRSGDAFEYRSEPEFIGWLFTIARRHVMARREYWFAGKRRHGAILRLTFSAGSGQIERRELADSATGPGTFAFRREQLLLATRAAAMLLPRDREIVHALVDGVTAPELSQRLGITVDAAEKAKVRAIERLRRAFELLSRAAPGNADSASSGSDSS